MPSELSKTSGLPRITFSLGAFDERVIEKMAEKREVSKSEIIRNLVHNWIEGNPEILQQNYGIALEDITREIRLDSKTKDLMELLLNSFKRTKKIHIDRLAAKLDINSNDLLRFIDENGDILENKGLNVIIDGEYILKE